MEPGTCNFTILVETYKDFLLHRYGPILVAHTPYMEWTPTRWISQTMWLQGLSLVPKMPPCENSTMSLVSLLINYLSKSLNSLPAFIIGRLILLHMDEKGVLV